MGARACVGVIATRFIWYKHFIYADIVAMYSFTQKIYYIARRFRELSERLAHIFESFHSNN